MSVAELIALLEQVEDKSLEVVGEGCDCDNKVVGVCEYNGGILIQCDV